MSENRIAEILKAFEVYDGIYKRAEVDAAIELQEEITPHLIAVLEEILADPFAYLAKPDYTYIYALMLLAHFKEERAHKVIVDLFSLPPNLPDQFFDDMITEDLPIMLLRTSGGDMELIKLFALNREADEYCRGSALDAIVLAVADGIISRDEALTFLASLFTRDEAELDTSFLDQAASAICDLYPEELMPIIEHAYRSGMIRHRLIGYDDFERVLADGKEYTLKQLQNKRRRKSMDNLHDYMSSWASFKQKEQPSPEAQALATLAKAWAESKKREASSIAVPKRKPPIAKSRNKPKKKKKGKRKGSSKKKRRK